MKHHDLNNIYNNLNIAAWCFKMQNENIAAEFAKGRIFPQTHSLNGYLVKSTGTKFWNEVKYLYVKMGATG